MYMGLPNGLFLRTEVGRSSAVDKDHAGAHIWIIRGIQILRAQIFIIRNFEKNISFLNRELILIEAIQYVYTNRVAFRYVPPPQVS